MVCDATRPGLLYSWLLRPTVVEKGVLVTCNDYVTSGCAGDSDSEHAVTQQNTCNPAPPPCAPRPSHKLAFQSLTCPVRSNACSLTRLLITHSQGCDRLLECGTTCTLALVQGDQLCVANVGDTAAALVRWVGQWWCGRTQHVLDLAIRSVVGDICGCQLPHV